MTNKNTDRNNIHRNNIHVVVLQGGLSRERDVSFSSAEGCIKALESLGYRVTALDVTKHVSQDLTELNPDIVFNALHGTYGEDGCIQGLLEILHIPYTHSGIEASAIAMNKSVTKSLLEPHGIPFPKGEVYARNEVLAKQEQFKRPCVIKPVAEGSSVGVVILHTQDDHVSDNSLLACKEFMVEEYIPGKELSVAVTDDRPLGVLELKPVDGFYDYNNKYQEGKTEHIMPADIPEAIYTQAMDIALHAHRIVGCLGISRSDFRYHEEKNTLYFLEINSQPGLTPLSIVPEIAEHSGMSYGDMVEYLIERAQCQK